MAFADPIKAMMRALGLSEREITSSSLKEKPCDVLCGKTPRQAMQWIGTELGRNLIGQDLWVRVWAREAAKWPNVVCDDVRFPNEVDTIHRAGGVVVRIERASAGSTSGASHASEHQVLEADRVIRSEGTIPELWAVVDGLLVALSADA